VHQWVKDGCEVDLKIFSIHFFVPIG
jgi:hypothetical protein